MTEPYTLAVSSAGGEVLLPLPSGDSGSTRSWRARAVEGLGVGLWIEKRNTALSTAEKDGKGCGEQVRCGEDR